MMGGGGDTTSSNQTRAKRIHGSSGVLVGTPRIVERWRSHRQVTDNGSEMRKSYVIFLRFQKKSEKW
jgi:hypothetical protein